jgi:hypothetical protein
MTTPNIYIADEDIEDIIYSIFYPFIAIKNILNNFMCEFVKKK